MLYPRSKSFSMNISLNTCDDMMLSYLTLTFMQQVVIDKFEEKNQLNVKS